MAEEPAPTKRVELIDQGDRTSEGMPGYIGVGLIGGIVLGFGPLRDALTGTGPFEDAMIRFVACLLVCVAAASFIGRIFDSAPPVSEGGDSTPEGKADGDAGSGAEPSVESRGT